MRLLTTGRFERDLRRARRRGKNLDKLWAVVDRLLAGEPLEPRHRAHRLSGQWARSWECHIEPDWLLIWHVRDDALVLTRTGSHADLFGWRGTLRHCQDSSADTRQADGDLSSPLRLRDH